MPRPRSFVLAAALAALTLVGATLAACSASPPPSPGGDLTGGLYGALPPLPNPGPEARPASARITSGVRAEPQLLAFLDRLTAAVERRNWGAFAGFLDEAALQSQYDARLANGVSPALSAAHTLVDALGIENVGPQGPIASVPEPAALLVRLRNMTVEGVEGNATFGNDTGLYRVTGYARLDDRTTPRYTLYVRPTARGLRVVVPRR